MHEGIAATACARARVRLLALALLAPSLLALPSCGGGEAPRTGAGTAGGGPPGGTGGGRGGDRITPVEVAPATLGTLARTTMVSGPLEAIRSVGVNAQLPGALLSVRVEEGDQVRAGQTLAEVDAREVAAQLRGAEAGLALARSTAERSEQLWRDRVITAMEYERDQAALAAAQATRDALRTRLGFATVRAPIAGVVTEKRNEAGDIVQSQARLFTIADVSTLVARVPVSELDVAWIREGQRAEVALDALGGARFAGTVRRVFPAADTALRMVPVEVALSGAAAARLKPGFLARVTFRLDERSNVLVIPTGAVVGSGEARSVFVVAGDVAERRPVRLGRTSGERTEVLDGVRAGELVVVAGADEIRDGGRVRVVRPVGVEGGGTRTAAVRGAAVPASAVPGVGAPGTAAPAGGARP